MKRIAIFGVGGHGRSVAEILQGRDIVFLDDYASMGRMINGIVVSGSRAMLFDKDFLAVHEIIIGVGDCKLRGELSRKVRSLGGKLAKAIHPTACISSSAEIGDGTVVMPFAIIGSNVKIGMYCIINNRATVAHDSIVGNGASISDGAAFTTTVGEEAWLGLNVCVIPNTPIGARAIVGAGSVVTKEVLPDTTVAGVPARLIRNEGTHGVV